MNELRYLGKVKNQTDFGTQLGYGKAYFSQVMNGHESLSNAIAKEIETKFGVDANWLLIGEGKMFINNSEIIDNHVDDALNGIVIDEDQVHQKSSTTMTERLLMEAFQAIRRKDEQIAKKDEHMDRLITIIERIAPDGNSEINPKVAAG